MEKIRRSIQIHAPVAQVFDHLTNPLNLLEIWPSMVEVTNQVVHPNGGHAFDWVYKMAGLRFHGHCETVEIERNRLWVDHNASGIPSTFRWEYAGTDDTTDVRLNIEYELPLALLGRLAAPFLRRVNEREAETLLQNLKERMEAKPEAAAGATDGIGQPTA
jgi:uncharacterized membrane protein